MCSRSNGFHITSQAYNQVCLGKTQMFSHDALLCVRVYVWTLSSHDHIRFRFKRQLLSQCLAMGSLLEEERNEDMFAEWMDE